MQLEITAPSELTIQGNIKSIDDYMKLKDISNQQIAKGCVELTLNIKDSFSMPSSVIGYLLKLKEKEKIRIKIIAGDQRLYTLLNDLNLVEDFGVKVVGR